MSVTDADVARTPPIENDNSTEALLADLEKRGYKLWVKDGKLHYKSAEPVTPVVWHALQANYGKLVRLLTRDVTDDNSRPGCGIKNGDVTHPNNGGGPNVRKDNADWSKVADLSPKRGEDLEHAIAAHAAMRREAAERVKANPPEGADGIDMMFARFDEQHKIGLPAREAEAKRRVEASKKGGACAKCGRVIEDSEKAYLGVRTFVGMWGGLGCPITPHYEDHTVCEGCAPERMVTRPEYREFTVSGFDKPFRVRVEEHYEDAYCETCARPVVYQWAGHGRRRGSHIFCCYRCQYTYHNRRRAKRERFLREKTCEVCGTEFTAKRAHTKTCSPACKQKAYRERNKVIR